MTFGPLRWALAVGLSVGLAAAAKLASPGLKDVGSSAMTLALFGAGIALAIALLRPWSLIESGARVFARVLRVANLRRRTGDTTLLLRGPMRLAWPLRDALFRAHGWLAGFALGVALGGAAQSSSAQWLFGSRFEGAAVLLGPLIGVLAGAFVALALDRMPRLAATWATDGRVDALAVRRILEHGAGALLVLFAACALAVASAWTPTQITLTNPLPNLLDLLLYWTAVNALLMMPLITLAALLGFALPWLTLREHAEHKRNLWLVVLDADGEGAQRGTLTLELVDALAPRWRDGPMTVVLDAALDVGGEQLHAALTLGRERAMFPRIPVELADWGQLLPPPQHWLASPLRELHVPVSLMLPALERFAGAGDKIVLVCGSAEPLAAWRDRFRHADCVVVWHGAATTAAGATIAGFRAMALDELVSSGSLPEILSTVPIEAPLVTPVAPEPGPAKVEPTAPGVSMAASGSTPAEVQAMQSQAAEPEPPPAPAPAELTQATTPEPPATTTAAPTTVFVSYLREYRAMVRELEQALSALGMTVLYDQLVEPGQDWDLTLRQMLERADAVVAVVGKLSAGRGLQLAEIERSRQLAKMLIPVLVERFDEPAILNTIMAANTDRDGRLVYLADCRGEQLTDILRITAQRIAAVLDQRRAAVERAAPLASAAVAVPLTPTTTRTLSVSLGTGETLSYVELDEGQRSEWATTYQPALIDRLLNQLGDQSEWDVGLARTLTSLVLPLPLRAWVHAGQSLRLRLHVDQDTARFPWEIVFSLAGNDIAPASVVRELVGISRPGPVTRARRRTALLIANPSTAGVETAFKVTGGLVDLPGTQHEAEGVEKVLSAAGFAVNRSTGEPAIAVMQALFRDDHLCVLVAAHALYEREHDGKLLTGVPLSDGVLLTAREFTQMSFIPDLVVLGAERLARIEHQGDREAALRRSMVATLLAAGVRCVVAAATLLDDTAAAHFSIAFFEAMAAGARAEDAMLSARSRSLADHPKLNTWAAYQLYGDPDYRFPSAS